MVITLICIPLRHKHTCTNIYFKNLMIDILIVFISICYKVLLFHKSLPLPKNITICRLIKMLSSIIVLCVTSGLSSPLCRQGLASLTQFQTIWMTGWGFYILSDFSIILCHPDGLSRKCLCLFIFSWYYSIRGIFFCSQMILWTRLNYILSTTWPLGLQGQELGLSFSVKLKEPYPHSAMLSWFFSVFFPT